MLAADQVQAKWPLVGGHAGGGIAHYLRRVGQPLVRLEVEGAKRIAQLGQGLAECLVGGAQGAAKGLLVEHGRFGEEGFLEGNG
ncbi:hypothetical protein D3C85_1092010 [compost metagenome]